MKITGTTTALITPFIDQEVDVEGLKFNIGQQLAAGIDGILPLGSTGEASTLSAAEQELIIKIAVAESHGKVPVWVGTGSYCTRTTIEKTKRAQDLGADIALIVTPYYNRPTQEGLFRHFEAIATKTNIPIVIYNIPGRCGTNIETSTMLRLAGLPNVIGVKESSGNINQAGDILYATRHRSRPFHLLSGDDVMALPMIALGATGLVSVVSNLIPHDIITLVKAALNGQFDIARQIHQRLLPLYKAAFLETNPVPIKTAMQLCGMPAGKARLPLYQMAPENVDILHRLLNEMELSKEYSTSHR